MTALAHRERPKLGRLTLWIVCGVIGIFLVVPTLIVIPMSFNEQASLSFPPQGFSTKWYVNFFEDPSWIGALAASVRIGALVSVVATIAGTAAALALVHSTFRGREVVRLVLLAPMIVPVIILAIGVYAIFLRLHLLGTTFGFVAVHSVLALPFVIIPVTASLQGFDRRLEDAAASCGASKLTTFRQVTLPLILPGIMTGALFAFGTSFDEVVVSLFIKSPYLETLPVKMYSSITRDTDLTIAAAATLILALVSIITCCAVVILSRRNRVN